MSDKYEILYIDGPQGNGLTILNYESFIYGLERSTVDPESYNITKKNANYSIIEAKNIVLDFINNTPNIDTLIQQNKFFILVLSSNQLTGAIEALKEKNIDHNEKVLIIASSGLGILPEGQNVSLLYSGNKEIDALIIHQKIHKIKYSIMIYEKDNVFCEDYKKLYEEKNLMCDVIYIPLDLNNKDNAVNTLNNILYNIYKKQPCKICQLEIILNVFTGQANYIIPKINYYKGMRVICNIASDGADPVGQNINLPVMITQIIPLDITSASNIYYKYMLKYDDKPSAFAPAYYDSGVQLGQMMKLNLEVNVTTFSNRLTVFDDEKSVQYGGAWINPIERRNINANYGYIYTYDPIMNTKEKIDNYNLRSPWMPILPSSASMPYFISNAYWVEPKKWVVYYSEWRYFPEIENKPEYLKYYLGMDYSEYIKNAFTEFTISGYASSILAIYYKKKNNKEVPVLFIPKNDENIFKYPFDYSRTIII